MLERVDEMTCPPIVGQAYLVPCIWGRPLITEPALWVPVTGPLHDDFEILRVRHLHWHIDHRFGEDWYEEAMGRSWTGWPESPLLAILTEGHTTHRTPVWHPLVCRRGLEEVVPLPRYGAFPDLEAAYARATLRTCRVCPHRGVPLASLPVSPEGTVTCPGHGLTWDVGSGRLVRRAG